MGVYRRPDSPFFWLLLERIGQRPIRETTRIVVDGGTPAQTTLNRRHAQAAYAKRMQDLASRRYQLPGAVQQRTFAAHRSWYAEHVSAHKRGTTREVSMLKQLGAFFDNSYLDDIDHALAREWRTWRAKGDISASTIRREEALLKHLLTTAVPKYLERNPLAGLQRLRVAIPDTRVLSAAEETALLKALLTPEDKALVVCALDTLLRLSNVRNLTWKQDHGAYLFSDTKTDAIRIPISARLRAALDGLKHAGANVFPTYAGETNNDAIRMFREACERADVQVDRKTGGISFHCLRHTGATRMLAAGVDVKTVMEIGGWKNLKVLERYLHPSDARKAEAVNLIANHVPRTRKAQSGRKVKKIA